MNLKEREAQACTIIDGIQDELKSVSLFLHNNPELGQQEVRAVQLAVIWSNMALIRL